MSHAITQIEVTFRRPMEGNRLEVLSPFAYGKPSRQSMESCSIRNHFVLGFSKERNLPHVAVGSSLATDLAMNDTTVFPLP
jgi:hypothetical protein